MLNPHFVLHQIQTAIDLDGGDANFYTLIVEVGDGGTPELTGTATVYVSVTSSNDADPVFGATTPTGSIPVSFILHTCYYIDFSSGVFY